MIEFRVFAMQHILIKNNSQGTFIKRHSLSVYLHNLQDKIRASNDSNLYSLIIVNTHETFSC